MCISSRSVKSRSLFTLEPAFGNAQPPLRYQPGTFKSGVQPGIASGQAFLALIGEIRSLIQTFHQEARPFEDRPITCPFSIVNQCIVIAILWRQDAFAELSLRAEERGANVWLVLSDDEGVFHGGRAVEGVRCVHPVQIYLDLQAHPERAQEAAEKIRAVHLSWKADG